MPTDRYEVAQYSPFLPIEYGIWDHANRDWATNLWVVPYRYSVREDAEAQAKRLNDDSDW
jgi:hypothetical protein